MHAFIQFILMVIIQSSVLYLITNKLMMISNSPFVKSLIVTVIIAAIDSGVALLVGDPHGFHAGMFAKIANYLTIIPALLTFKIAYDLTVQQLFFFIVGYRIILFVVGFTIIPITAAIY